VAVAVAPDGRVSGYVHGVRPEPGAVSAALAAAAAGDAGKSLGDLVARCFQYVPAARRWSGELAAFLRAGGAAILLGALAVVALAERRRRRLGRRAGRSTAAAAPGSGGAPGGGGGR
jgi:protein SCO1/2